MKRRATGSWQLSAALCFGVALASGLAGGQEAPQDIEQALSLGRHDRILERLGGLPSPTLVDALYTSSRDDLILEALVVRADDASTFPLLDLLEWQIATSSSAAGMTAVALGRLGDRRALPRLHAILVDPSRPAWLRLEAARAVDRLGGPNEVATARHFLLELHRSALRCCDDDAPVPNRDFDVTELIIALGEIGDDGQRTLGEWLLAGTPHFAEELQIMGRLLAEPTPSTLDTLLEYAERVDHEPRVQVELLERLLTMADEALDLPRALLLTEQVLAGPAVDDSHRRLTNLHWRLERRLDGSLPSVEGNRWLATLDELDPEAAILVLADRLLQEQLDKGDWRIHELSPTFLTGRSATEPRTAAGIAEQLLQQPTSQHLDLLRNCAQLLSFAPDLRASLLSIVEEGLLDIEIEALGPKTKKGDPEGLTGSRHLGDRCRQRAGTLVISCLHGKATDSTESDG